MSCPSTGSTPSRSRPTTAVRSSLRPLAAGRMRRCSAHRAAPRFYVASVDADRWWGEDDPIFDRLDETTYVSFDGIALSSVLSSTASIAATLDGTIAYCSASQDPVNKDYPLRCAS